MKTDIETDTKVMGDDSDRYEALIRRHDALILGECLRVLRRHQDLPIDEDDLMSDVLVEIWRSMKNIEAADNQDAYVRSVVRYVAERSISKEMRHYRTRDTSIILDDE